MSKQSSSLTFSLLGYCQPETLSNISSHYGHERDNDEDDERWGNRGRERKWRGKTSLTGKEDAQTHTYRQQNSNQMWKIGGESEH